MIKKLYKKYEEVILYVVFGGLTTLVNFVSFWAFNKILGEKFYLVSNVIAWFISVVFAYVTNKLWVFQSKSWKREVVFKEFGLFVSSRLLTGTLEIIGVPFLVKMGLNYSVMGIEGLFAKVLVSVLVVILNYILSKLVIFKK